MNPQTAFCPNQECPARGQTGKGNIGIHSRKERRYKCKVCGRTFRETRGTLFHGLKTDRVTVTLVLMLLAWGCPRIAIVKAFGIDERTVHEWLRRASAQCEAVHAHLVMAQPLDLVHVQADEIKVKLQGCSVWARSSCISATGCKGNCRNQVFQCQSDSKDWSDWRVCSSLSVANGTMET